MSQTYLFFTPTFVSLQGKMEGATNKVYRQTYQDQDYSSKVLTGLSKLRNQDLLCDVTIHVEDKAYPCHKIVLASACNYFFTMFTGDFKEKQETDIKLEQIHPAAFNVILDFFYKGEMQVDTVNVCNIFKAALFWAVRTYRAIVNNS